MIGVQAQLEIGHSVKPTELLPHLRPACRRVMLRHTAALARDMLDYADDIRLRASKHNRMSCWKVMRAAPRTRKARWMSARRS